MEPEQPAWTSQLIHIRWFCKLDVSILHPYNCIRTMTPVSHPLESLICIITCSVENTQREVVCQGLISSYVGMKVITRVIACQQL